MIEKAIDTPGKMRSELKFWVPLVQMQQIKQTIAPYVRRDPYTFSLRYPRYSVHTIYFDSPQLDFYYEKMDGLKVRKKVRLRTYNRAQDHAPFFLEIKRRHDRAIIKERCMMSHEEIQDWWQKKDGKNLNKKHITLERIDYLMNAYRLRPQILVTYDRDAFIDRDFSTVRLTLDTNLAFTSDPELKNIYRDGELSYSKEGEGILEFKFNGLMPRWMRQLTTRFSLRFLSISKYCIGVEHALRSSHAHIAL
ncbi:VTC domain-containing protein [candidate division KSB1 bacterium]|nr:VTC domain-containing protein [candidate division KSB1 bacterium]